MEPCCRNVDTVWDGIVWVKLRPQLNDEEKARQLRVGAAASTKARDDFSVFEMNDVYLEATQRCLRTARDADLRLYFYYRTASKDRWRMTT